MEKLTPNQIKAADAIIYDEVGAGTTSPPRILTKSDENGWGLIESDIIKASEFLNEHGFITIIDGKGDLYYRVKPLGEKYKGSGKSIADYLEEISAKEAKQLQREERDEKYKELQMEDLITKLNTINPNQLDFWKAQKQKNLQTTLIAILSALFSLFALMKTWGLF